MPSIDHFFVFAQSGAPEREALSAAGLRGGAEREHTGQGTRSVGFELADCFLELIWLADAEAARTPMVKPLGLYERMAWRDHRASPFGVCLRPDDAGDAPPFLSWDYRPDYLPPEVDLQMACNSGVVGEPLLFQLDRSLAPPATAPGRGERRLRRVTITTPALAPMSPLREVDVDRLALRDGEEHLMEVELMGAGHALDLRPALPLILHA
ncbi:MAG TPA: hypothetical protein ENI87_06100 [bacterium]|nr:hypothetical protein [bacterium]